MADPGVLHRDDRRWVRVTGADRADYLHRMLTQDVLGIAPAQVRPACLLNPRGRILADLLIWNAGDHYALDLPGGAPGAIAALEKYVIMEDTAFESDDAARLDVVGEAAAGAIEAAGLSVPDRGQCREGTLGAAPVAVIRSDLGRLPRFLLHVPVDALPASREALAEAGATPWDMQTYHRIRVEEGVPEFGAELGEDVLFNEAGLRNAVSWSKGCFPGQEPVVMAMDRGRAPRSLCVLASAGPLVPTPGETLRLAEDDVGRVTSAAASPTTGDVRLLGYVSHQAAQVGAELETQAGVGVRIVRVHRLTRT